MNYYDLMISEGYVPRPWERLPPVHIETNSPRRSRSSNHTDRGDNALEKERIQKLKHDLAKQKELSGPKQIGSKVRLMQRQDVDSGKKSMKESNDKQKEERNDGTRGSADNVSASLQHTGYGQQQLAENTSNSASATASTVHGQDSSPRIPMTPITGSAQFTPSANRLATAYKYGRSPESNNVKNIRRVLAIAINNHEGKACPDSGSSENIMREDWTRDHKLKVRRTPRDRRKLFQLGNGRSVRAEGRVRADVRITRAASSSRPRKKEWFYVFKECPVPIILGMPFLESEAIFTRNQHLLEACPKAYSDIDSLLWIGSPRNQIRCSLNGRQEVATADTGSDINLMSLEYAKKNGHWIDDRPEVRRRLQFGDRSVAETMGQVYVNNFSLDWRSPAATMELEEDGGIHDEKPQNDDMDDTNKVYVWQYVVFHVLPDLPCDIILGRPLLKATDAFSQQEMHLASSEHKCRRETGGIDKAQGAMGEAA
ncbi:hypothetical protein PG993_013855 [Apiospora rasikravindrae]|uniref:Uncharacterized protein n=1 Tax=Apiospora rasikravindrae TaxID=990691 RepID=A0ABR1RRE3_9PEZI